MNRTTDNLDRIPPGQQLVAPGKWPVIGEREPASVTEPWTLSISGEVNRPTQWTLDQLTKLPQSTMTIDIHCVTRWSKLDVEFSGVRLADLIEQVEPTNSANYISFVARSARGHSTSLKLADALELETMIALQVDGRPLEVGHGGPIRNIVPGRYFYKSVKWLERIELLSQDRLGMWEAESGYHNQADPWLEQRYMAPSINKREAAKLMQSRDFSGRDLRSLDASDRELNQLNAHGALLRDARFDRAQLQDANFESANLSNAHFQQADLNGANFRNADVEGADFSGADLRGVDFTGASMIGASFFSPQNDPPLEAVIDRSTVLPDEVLAPLFPEQRSFVDRQRGDSTSDLR